MSSLEKGRNPSTYIQHFEDGKEDRTKEYLSLVYDKLTQYVETSGSKLGLDFLIKNKDVEDRFKSFCETYRADVSMLPSDEASLCNAQSNIDEPKQPKVLEKREISERSTSRNRTKKEKLLQDVKDVPFIPASPPAPPTSRRKSARSLSKSVRGSEVITLNKSKTKNKREKKVKYKKTVCKPPNIKEVNSRIFVDQTELKEKTVSDELSDNEIDDGGSDHVDDCFVAKQNTEDNLEGGGKPEELREKDKEEVNQSDSFQNSRKRGNEENDITQNGEKKKLRRRGKLFVLYNENKKSYECLICYEGFPSHAEAVKHHAAEHTAKKHFPCQFCPKILTCREGWKRHTIMLHNQFPDWILKCEYCDQAFVDKRRFNKHLETCVKIYIHHCDVCEKKFSTVGALESHKLSAHSSDEVQEKLKCPICEEIFGTEEDRKLHEKCHEDPNNQCDICKKWFSSAEVCSKHKVGHDKTLEKNHNEHVCQYCNRIFKQLTAFHRHLELHRKTNNGEKFSCSVCHKVCKSAITYKHHMRLHLPNDKKPYQCSICGKGYPTAKSLGVHETTHSDKLHAFCEYCGKGFKEKRFLATHIRIAHTGEKPYVCQICGKTFFTTGGRREHILAMHNTSSIICELCGKEFPSRARLAAHKSRHKSSDLKFECEVCKRVFNTRTSYLTHYVTIHLTLEDADKFPQKVHPCSSCKKLFLCKNKLKMHERVHTGEKPEVCHICNKGFADRANLRAHLKIHSEEKPFQCEICPKQFIQKRALRKHMETHEDNDKVPDVQSSLITHEEQSKMYPVNIQNEERYDNNTIPSVTPQRGAVGVQYVHDLHLTWSESAAIAAANVETHLSTIQLQQVMQQQ